jgi:hypothetical protein
VGKLYEAVHPGEGLDKIALPLDPAKRASMEFKAKFAGPDAPPQGTLQIIRGLANAGDEETAGR